MKVDIIFQCRAFKQSIRPTRNQHKKYYFIISKGLNVTIRMDRVSWSERPQVMQEEQMSYSLSDPHTLEQTKASMASMASMASRGH